MVSIDLRRRPNSFRLVLNECMWCVRLNAVNYLHINESISWVFCALDMHIYISIGEGKQKRLTLRLWCGAFVLKDLCSRCAIPAYATLNSLLCNRHNAQFKRFERTNERKRLNSWQRKKKNHLHLLTTN